MVLLVDVPGQLEFLESRVLVVVVLFLAHDCQMLLLGLFVSLLLVVVLSRPHQFLQEPDLVLQLLPLHHDTQVVLMDVSVGLTSDRP